MINSTYQRFLEACQKCLIDCQVCLTEMATKESMNDCPKCCIQCVDACTIAIKFIAADSKWAEKYIALCAEICEWCATECAEHDHEHCQACAASCRECVNAYKEIKSR